MYGICSIILSDNMAVNAFCPIIAEKSLSIHLCILAQRKLSVLMKNCCIIEGLPDYLRVFNFDGLKFVVSKSIKIGGFIFSTLVPCAVMIDRFHGSFSCSKQPQNTRKLEPLKFNTHTVCTVI